MWHCYFYLNKGSEYFFHPAVQYTKGLADYVEGMFGTHPESRLHLGLEDVTLKMIREHCRGGRRVQRLFRQLLLLSLAGGTGRKVKTLEWELIVSRMGQRRAGKVSDLVVHVDVQRGPGGRITLCLQSLEQRLRDVQLICRGGRSSTF